MNSVNGAAYLWSPFQSHGKKYRSRKVKVWEKALARQMRMSGKCGSMTGYGRKPDTMRKWSIWSESSTAIWEMAGKGHFQRHGRNR